MTKTIPLTKGKADTRVSPHRDGAGRATMRMNQQLTLQLADQRGLAWAQQQVTQYHYLHRPVDIRSSPMAYVVLDEEERRAVGCLIFGRPQATRVSGWYGDVFDVQEQRCPLTRWQVLNLARCWLDPAIQHGGEQFIQNAATQVIAQALRRAGYDYLMLHPPCFLTDPYEVRECLSYNDLSRHAGTLYRAANFRLVRENARGMQTYAIPLRHLTHAERRDIEQRAEASLRSRRYRAMRAVAQVEQGVLFSV
jgi:hypothetical protein